MSDTNQLVSNHWIRQATEDGELGRAFLESIVCVDCDRSYKEKPGLGWAYCISRQWRCPSCWTSFM